MKISIDSFLNKVFSCEKGQKAETELKGENQRSRVRDPPKPSSLGKTRDEWVGRRMDGEIGETISRDQLGQSGQHVIISILFYLNCHELNNHLKIKAKNSPLDKEKKQHQFQFQTYPVYSATRPTPEANDFPDWLEDRQGGLLFFAIALAL